MDRVLKNISGSGRVSGTRWTLLPTAPYVLLYIDAGGVQGTGLESYGLSDSWTLADFKRGGIHGKYKMK